MKHSQYLLPALPDLLKSHRLSYKKFLHNGIDEEFDLLSAKTELNEEEIFYESLKFHHVDELSPSHVESLDYIYHPEEKIFLMPKRTLEDSLRGRQSHSFHLFIPLELKILPFQDELETTHQIPRPFSTESLSRQRVRRQRFGEKNSRFSPSNRVGKKKSDGNLAHIFFRGGSGQPLSENQKEFFQTALIFFFQQPKIQKIDHTKRFLLLRWFCEKLQYIEPIFAEHQPIVRTSINTPLSQTRTDLSSPEMTGKRANQVDSGSFTREGTTPKVLQKTAVNRKFQFSQSQRSLESWDPTTQRKLYQIYQSILGKLQYQTHTKKVGFPRKVLNSLSGEKLNFNQSGKKRTKKVTLETDVGKSQSKGHWTSVVHATKENFGEFKWRSATLFKHFRKTSLWSGLIDELKNILQENQSLYWDKRVEEHSASLKAADLVSDRGVLKLEATSSNYPQFPDLPAFTRAIPHQKAHKLAQFSSTRRRIAANKMRSKVRQTQIQLNQIDDPENSSNKFPQNLFSEKSFPSEFTSQKRKVKEYGGQKIGAKKVSSEEKKQPKGSQGFMGSKALNAEIQGIQGRQAFRAKAQAQKKNNQKENRLKVSKKFSQNRQSEPTRASNFDAFDFGEENQNLRDDESHLFENSDLFLDDDLTLEGFGSDLVKAFQQRNLATKIDGATHGVNPFGENNTSRSSPEFLEKLGSVDLDHPFTYGSTILPSSSVFPLSALSLFQSFVRRRSGKSPKTPRGFAGKRFKPRKKIVQGYKRLEMGVQMNEEKVVPSAMAKKLMTKATSRSAPRSTRTSAENSKIQLFRAKSRQGSFNSLEQQSGVSLHSSVDPNLFNFNTAAFMRTLNHLGSGNSESSQLFEQFDLPGFQFKTSRFTAGRKSRRIRNQFSLSLASPASKVAGQSGADSKIALSQGPLDIPTSGLRFGKIESTKTGASSFKKGQRNSQRLTILKRLVHVKEMKNQKKKLEEIFFTLFPGIAEQTGLRVWKLRNSFEKKVLTKRMSHTRSSLEESSKWPPGENRLDRLTETKLCLDLGVFKPKFLKHFKKENLAERHLKLLKPRQLHKRLKSVLIHPKLRSFDGPSKFISLPQNEIGSIWKVIPKENGTQLRVQGRPSVATPVPSQTGFRKSARLNLSKARSVQFYQLHKLAYRQRNMLLLHAQTQQTGDPKSAKPLTDAVSNRASRTEESRIGRKSKKDTVNRVKSTSKAGSSFSKPMSSLGKTIVGSVQVSQEKKLEFNRFLLKSNERRALHSKKTFSVRSKVAWKIEKKAAKLGLLPGLHFWQPTHSNKKVEEYWEAILQVRRKKLPAKVLVSAPTGEFIFVKSEKESRPKPFYLPRSPKRNSSRLTLSREHPNDVEKYGMVKGLLGNPVRSDERQPVTPGNSSSDKRKGDLLVRGVSKKMSSVRVHRGSSTQLRWALELVNMKFFTKKMVTYSPALLEWCWNNRLLFLWNALSEPDPVSGFSSMGPILRARENLPKVCLDLRQLLSSVYELVSRKLYEPQMFFVSGQRGKREWPIHPDGSKSYFSLLNLGKMPFMTKQGNFLINGSARVLVSQVAKCPNFYTKMKIDSRGRPRYWTEFVSSFKNAGEWIQFHIDLENKMFFSLGTKRKYSIFIFLGALGISPPEIPDVIEHWDFLKQSIHQEEISSDFHDKSVTYLVEPLEVREARILFHDTQNYVFHPGAQKTDEELQKFFEDIFYNPARYFLGHAGREALNQRRRFSGAPSRSRALEKEDFLAAINALIEVRLGLAPPDDIDHLKFRRVRLPGELLQNEFHLALDEIFTLDFMKFREGPLPGDALEPQPKDQRRTIFPTLQALEQKIFEKGRPFAVSKTVGLQSTYQVTPLEKRMRNFFHTGQLSQYMDQTNPLAEITHKRRLTSLGPDGLPKQVGVAVRELHPSHFGRICPIETPEGLNAGLVASLSSQAKIGSHHTLLAPYYWVKDKTREFPQKIFNNEIPRGANLDQVFKNNLQQTTSLSIGNQIEPMGFSVPTRSHREPDPLLGQAAVGSLARQTAPDGSIFSSGNPGPALRVLKYPPVLPEIIFLSASAEDSVYICSEDYWFSSKYKNFENVAVFPSQVSQTEKPTPLASPNLGVESLQFSTLNGVLASEFGLFSGGLEDSTNFPQVHSLSGIQNLTKFSRVDVNEQSSSGGAANEVGPFDEMSWIAVDSKNSLVKCQTMFPARYQQEFFTVTKSHIDFFAICPTQMISVGTSLIPFLEHDDANRALMGSNMQRQALPLLVLERPLVGTGSEKGVAQSSNSVLLSEFSGQVSFVDGRKIIVDSFPKTITSFPESSKASRLLLGSSTLGSTTLRDRAVFDDVHQERGTLSQTGQQKFSVPQNLFQKFHHRSEDGKMKTIRRIFTVTIQINGKQTKSHQKVEKSSFKMERKDSSRQVLAPAAVGLEKSFTVVKVFPISDEEYEKSRTLLRRELIHKYHEIQKKKIFRPDFWPGERWKKTGTRFTDSSLSQDLQKIKPFFSDEVKRIRFQKPNLTLAKTRISKAKRPLLGLQNLFVSTRTQQVPHQLPSTRQAGLSAERAISRVQPTHSVFIGGAFKKTFEVRFGRLRSHLRKSREKMNPRVPIFMLTKNSLRRSILPLKAGRVFFEPTPQMIFKNILSKNAKKREILRRALIEKAFLPQHFESMRNKNFGDFAKPHQKTSNEVSSKRRKQGWLGDVPERTLIPSHLLASSLETTHPGKWSNDQASKRFKSFTRVKKMGLSRSPVSWSISVKKITPYTQVTYDLHGYWRTNQNTLRRQRPSVRAGDWVSAGDLLADSSATLQGELCVGQNILVGYVPWEGYNFEDAIVVNERLVEQDIYTSILIDRYEMEAAIDAGEKITRKIPDLKPHFLKNLDRRGIICVGTWVEEDDILVGKIVPVTTELQGYSKLLADIYQIAPPIAKDVSFRVPDRISGRVLESSVSEMIVRTPENQSVSIPWKVTLYLVEKRRLKLGDKMSGRHGNKGIVSIILPPQDMPFLPDGTPLDVALNPLGVPSRMNVGQLLESLLGLAGHHLHQKYRVPAFDEMYGEEFSRRLVYDKLFEASQKTQKPWLFNPNFPGKMMLRDGRTGEYLHQPVLVGYPYMLKLIHMVDDKMHARATGPYTMVTQQPLKGRANRGGQRLGEMEVWAVEAFAASYALQELLTLKSDDVTGRNHFLMSFLKRKKRTVGGIPDAFRVLVHELQSLCFHVHYTEDYRFTYPTFLESSQIPETPIPGSYGRGS